jgi:hypothetical protein
MDKRIEYNVRQSEVQRRFSATPRG